MSVNRDYIENAERLLNRAPACNERVRGSGSTIIGPKLEEPRVRTTPDRITHLKPGQIFVFGSNYGGRLGAVSGVRLDGEVVSDIVRGYTEWDEYGSGHFQTVPDPPKPKSRTNKTKADLIAELAEAKEDIQAAVDRAKAEAAIEIAMLTKREAELRREFEAVNSRLSAALAEQGRLNGVIDNLKRDLAGIGGQPTNGGRFMLLELE